jgi:class 3 adenylate cyclase/tetratricopeptide (TPR) repeat protein
MTHESRRTVTVVFVDLAGSTGLGEQLDPEPLRRVMSRYFETVSQALEGHGGRVEKFIGDAVMAVFGIPVVHEDDAFRAARAVIDVREAVARLNDELERERGVRIEIRTGVNTGEVFTGDPSAGSTLATGDAVNVAARLEQAAGAGEILIGDATHRLVRDAVRAEPVEDLRVKGKEGAVAAWRLREIVEGAAPFARHLDSPLVGREVELAQLRQAYERAVRERRAHLFTILGPAGIGKSRLSGEFAALLAEDASVLVGRCLPYGEGITFWPLSEILHERFGDDVQVGVARMLAPDEDAELVAARIAGAVGFSADIGTSEETFWAIRKFFERLAHEQPLVVVFEDIHWAEPTFLDLLDHVADWTHDAPVLLLCLARPELLEARPTWGGGKLNATAVLLEPLSEDESETLIANLLGEAEVETGLRDRIAEAAEGNPLFVEQMLAMMGENGHGNGGVAVPPTIQALLAARLDRLEPAERAVAERASVVGKEFWRGAVVDLSPENVRSSVGEQLQMLVRKELIHPHRSVFVGDDGFRFRHMLIRDAAYGGMPKEARADLHERFAEWLERQAGERAAEYEEIVGYHLEQAYRYREELGPVDATGRELADRAAERLASAGRRARDRSDMPAAAKLLDRAAALLPADSTARLELIVDLGPALEQVGELARANAVLEQAAEMAAKLGDRRLEAHARVEHALVKGAHMPQTTFEETEPVAREAIRVFEELGDDLGLARAWRLRSFLPWGACRWGEMGEVLEQALAHARRASARIEERAALSFLAVVVFWGPTPVKDALLRLDEMRADAPEDRVLEASILNTEAALRAMLGQFEEAQMLAERGSEMYTDLGQRTRLAGRSLQRAEIELLAGDPAAAEGHLREGYDIFHAMGETGVFSTIASALGEAVYRQGRYDEAESLSEISEEATAPDDIASLVGWRAVRAKVLARRGEFERAEKLVDEAVELSEATDFLNMQADVLLDRAEVLRLAGRANETRPSVEGSIALYEQKGNVVAATHARALLSELDG